jgi:hypothetical protein
MTKSTGRSERTRRPALCQICRHSARAEIEIACVKGVSMGAIAKTHGVSYDSLWRHQKNHISPARRAELAYREVVPMIAREEKSIGEQLGIIRNGMFDAYLTAKVAGDIASAALASSKFNENVITAAKVLDGMKSSVTIHNTQVNNFHSSPAYLKLVDIVLEACADFPEARLSIVRAVRNFNNDAAPAAKPNGSRPPMIEGEIEAELEGAHVN